MFKALRRWVAVFGDRAAIDRNVWGAWHGGLCEDHLVMSRDSRVVWFRGDVLGCGKRKPRSRLNGIEMVAAQLTVMKPNHRNRVLRWRWIRYRAVVVVGEARSLVNGSH